MKVKFTNIDISLHKKISSLGYAPNVDFQLRTENEYSVYGIMMWRSVLHYLVIPDNTLLPNWYPAAIFQVVDVRIPADWHFIHFREDDPSERDFLLGYKELIQDATHYVDLIERGVNAIRVFNMRREEIENSFLD